MPCRSGARSLFLTPLLLAGILLGCGLLGLAATIDERRRRAPGLPAPPVPDAAPGEPVTVLLPVRDEEENVLDCLAGLLAQSARPAIRVVDDGSTDATASLVASLAAAEPRLTLLAAGPLPAGWRGKVHALAAGASPALATPWLLTTDADARHHPELLARALAAARRHRLDAVSLAGTQVAVGWENLLVPPVFALLDALLGDWEAAADSAGAPVANGQFLLLRRDAWERCGGFASVADAALDDVATAARLRACGFRTGFLRAPGLLTVRMYRGLRAATAGWRRNLGGLFGGRPGATLAPLAVLLLPPVVLALGLALGAWVPALLLWAAGAAASALLRQGSGHRPAWGLLYPLDALVLAAVLAQSLRDHRRGRLMAWKGREMRV